MANHGPCWTPVNECQKLATSSAHVTHFYTNDIGFLLVSRFPTYVLGSSGKRDWGMCVPRQHRMWHFAGPHQLRTLQVHTVLVYGSRLTSKSFQVPRAYSLNLSHSCSLSLSLSLAHSPAPSLTHSLPPSLTQSFSSSLSLILSLALPLTHSLTH